MRERAYRADICNICNSAAYRVVRHFAEWNLGREPVRDVDIIQCNRCGIRRRSPGIVDDYEREYHEPYVEQGQAIHPHQLSHFADLMTARLGRLNEKGVRFLDVGCSTGRVLQLARTLGFTPVGLDFSKWAAEYCKTLGFETYTGSLIGRWEESERFEIVHCSHTIEHVPDPVAYLKEMKNLLTVGGHLMLSLPNYNSAPRMMLRAEWPIWCLDSHLWQFSRQQMRRLIEAEGLMVLSVRTHHGYTPVSRFKRRLLDLSASLGWGDGCNFVAVRV